MSDKQPGEVREYDVHLFHVVRLKVCRLRASSPEEAIVLAEQRHDTYQAFAQRLTPEEDRYDYAEWAEEIVEALVDVVGDEDYTQSHRHIPGAGGWELAPGEASVRAGEPA